MKRRYVYHHLFFSILVANYNVISNFRRVLNVVCFLLGNSLTSEVYMPTFQNTLPVKMEQTECSKMSAYKLTMPGNYPEESIK